MRVFFLIVIHFLSLQCFADNLTGSSTNNSIESLTLQQAIRESGEHSPRLQKAKAMQEESSWKKIEALNSFLPTLTAQANYLFNKKYLLTDVRLNPSQPEVSIAQVIPTTLFTVTGTLPLFEGRAGLNRYSSASSFSSASQKEYAWTEFQISREVILQFYKTLAAKELLQVAEQNLKTLQDHLKDVNLFKKAGISTNYDVLRVEVQVSEAESEVLNTTDNLSAARNKLTEIMGLEFDQRELVGTWPTFNAKKTENLIKAKLTARQDLQALELRSEGARSLSHAASSYWIPRLALFGQYQYYNNRDDHYDSWDKYREAYQVGLSMTWNLFDGMTSIARDHESFQQSVQSDKSLVQARLKAQQDLEFWKRKYLYFGTVFRARQSDVLKAEESVRLARQGKKVGTRTDTDILDAEVELFRARAGLVNAQMGALESLVNLELTTGDTLIGLN
ncbi:MAG TPA: TolC family protein [Pseudobdellovibrionaceae bacterium]|jgi:outer membrane protein TolC